MKELTIENLDEQLAKAISTAQAILKQLQQAKQKPWEPKGGNYYIDYEGDIDSSYSNKNQRLFGNEFQTKESAEHTAPFFRFYHRLCQLAIELNPSGKVGGLYYLTYSQMYDKWNVGHDTVNCRIDEIFETREAAQKACDIMNRDGWRLPL